MSEIDVRAIVNDDIDDVVKLHQTQIIHGFASYLGEPFLRLLLKIGHLPLNSFAARIKRKLTDFTGINCETELVCLKKLTVFCPNLILGR